MVSCLAKHVKYQLLQGETILDHLHAYVTFICSFVAQGTGLLVEEQKMAGTVLADLISTEIHWHWVVPATYPCRYLSLGSVPEWFPAWPNV